MLLCDIDDLSHMVLESFTQMGILVNAVVGKDIREQ
jgi:hypothetical protein